MRSEESQKKERYRYPRGEGGNGEVGWTVAYLLFRSRTDRLVYNVSRQHYSMSLKLVVKKQIPKYTVQ